MDSKLFVNIVIVFTLIATLVFSTIGLVTQNLVVLFILATIVLVSGIALLIYSIKYKSLTLVIAITFILTSLLIFKISISLT